MPFNVANSLQNNYPDLIGIDQLKRRNALAERDQQVQETNAASYQDQLAMTQEGQRRNWLAQDSAAQKAQQDEAAQWAYSAAQHLAQVQDPAQFSAIADQLARDPRAQMLQITRDKITPDNVQQIVRSAALNAGVAPTPTYEQVDGPRGSVMQRGPGGKLDQVVGPDNSQPSAASTNRVRTMSQQEVAQAGLPQGTSAQIDSNGKIDILNKREGLSAAEQKTVREAKMRMPRLNAALRRVDRLGKAVSALSNNVAFNGGPMDAKVLQYRPEGREVMAASAQLMPELTALTRVPGIGSQSDLEARLASLAMPSLEMPPEVNARSQAELLAFVQDLKAAYESLLSGGQPEAAPSVGGWSVQEVR